MATGCRISVGSLMAESSACEGSRRTHIRYGLPVPRSADNGLSPSAEVLEPQWVASVRPREPEDETADRLRGGPDAPGGAGRDVAGRLITSRPKNVWLWADARYIIDPACFRSPDPRSGRALVSG
jgi:hypothetical protein